ncbi:MAG: P-II family nitrogen regulator [Actinomycetes bacterium]
MRQVTAIIQPHRLDAVRAALAHFGVTGLTVTEVHGYGRQHGHTEVYRGAHYRVDTLPKIRVDIVTDDLDAHDVVEVIATSARTGRIGDGKIWVRTIDEVVRIRTGERGVDAL